MKPCAAPLIATEGEVVHRADPAFERSLAPALQELLAPRMVPPGGAGKGDRACALRVLHRDDLADGTTHRCADHMGGLLAGIVEHGDGIIGHLFERVLAVRLVAASRAPVVEGDAPVSRCGGESLEVPAVLVGAEALDEEDRGAVRPTGDAVVDTNSVGTAKVGHQAPPRPLRGSQSSGVPVRISPILDASGQCAADQCVVDAPNLAETFVVFGTHDHDLPGSECPGHLVGVVEEAVDPPHERPDGCRDRG